MAHLVYKTIGAEFLDEFYSGTASQLDEAFEEAQATLSRGTDGIVDFAEARTRAGELPGDTPEDLSERWLRGGYAAKHAERIFRRGYEEAIRVARSGAQTLPIETLFVTGAGDEFELHVCEGKRQVTVVLFVPERRDYGSRRAESRSWVIRAGPAADGAETLDSGDPPIVKVPTSGRPR